MKNLILSILILFATVSITAQTTTDGLMFVAEEVQFAEKSYDYVNNNFKETWSWGEIQQISMPIYLGNNYVDMHNEGNVKITFTKKYEAQTSTDDEGNSYTLFPFDAIDDDGKSLAFYVQSWDDYEIVRLFMYYEKVAICYTGYIQ